MNKGIQNKMKDFLQDQFLQLCPVTKEVKGQSTNTLIPVYKVQLQDVTFVVPLDNSELRNCIDYAFKILDLFEDLYSSGLTQDKCTEISKSIEIKTFESLRAFHFFEHEEIASKADIISLSNEIATFRRIGGAYWMLQKGPMFYNMLYSVLTVIMDNFSDENLYLQCAFMIFRTILYLHDFPEQKE